MRVPCNSLEDFIQEGNIDYSFEVYWDGPRILVIRRRYSDVEMRLVSTDTAGIVVNPTMAQLLPSQHLTEARADQIASCEAHEPTDQRPDDMADSDP